MMGENNSNRLQSPTDPNAPVLDSVEPPGLPWFRTWRGVYCFVIGCFVAYIILLAVLSRIYS